MPGFNFNITFPVRVTVPEGVSKDEVVTATQVRFAPSNDGSYSFGRNLVIHALKFLVRSACGQGEVKVRLGRGERQPIVG